MTGWEIYYSYLGTDYDVSAVYTRNVVGSALVSAELIESGEDAGSNTRTGIYRFTIGSGNTVTLSMITDFDVENPDFWSGSKSVTCDDSTENTNLIPGVAIILSSLTAEDDVFEVAIGYFWDTTSRKWISTTSLGAGLIGTEDLGITLKIKNNTGRTQIQSKIYVANGYFIRNSVSAVRPILSSWLRNTGAVKKLYNQWDVPVSDYLFTFFNVSGGLCDFLLNGDIVEVYRVSDDTLLDSYPGQSIAYDGATAYRLKDEAKDLCFILSASLEDTDTATLTVSNSVPNLEIAYAVGEWQSAMSGFYLSLEGYAEGVVPDQEEVEIQLRRNIQSDADVTLNPFQFCLRVDSIGV